MTVFPTFENIKDNQSIDSQPGPHYWTPAYACGMKITAGGSLRPTVARKSQATQALLILSRALAGVAEYSNSGLPTTSGVSKPECRYGHHVGLRLLQTTAGDPQGTFPPPRGPTQVLLWVTTSQWNANSAWGKLALFSDKTLNLINLSSYNVQNKVKKLKCYLWKPVLPVDCVF